MSRKRRADWCYDLETDAWNDVLTAVAISDQGDVERWDVSTVADPGAACAEHLADVGGTVRAHWGGAFDHLLMWRKIPPRKVILAGSTALKAEDPKRHIIWRDTFPWWLASLETVGRATGVEKLPDVDRTTMRSMDPARRLAYCQRDTETLWSGVNACNTFLDQQGAARANTSGSSAVKLLKALDPASYAAMCDAECSWAALELAAGKVRGGRVESRVVGTVEGPLYVYDVHSCYPSRYAEGPIPLGLVYQKETAQHGTWWGPCEWTQPPLPLERTPAEIGGRLVGSGQVGTGRMRAWLTSETAAYLGEHGVKVERHPWGGFRPQDTVDAFAARFVRELYRQKEDPRKGPASFFAKVFLNSLHGKLSEGTEHWYYLREDDGTWRAEMDADRPRHQTPWIQPMAGAFVLQRARVGLHRAIHALEGNGWPVFYWDTDCVITTCPPERMPSNVPMGPGMGQWGLEAVAERGHFLASKMYSLEMAGGKHKTRSKGIPRGKMDPGTFLKAMSKPQEIAFDGLDRFRGAVGTISHATGDVVRPGSGFGAVKQRTRTVQPVTSWREPVDTGRGFSWLRYLPG